MTLAPWRSPLARALHRNRSLPYARYVQLATVRADGKPANRTIVFRGMLDPGNGLQFITDRRSEKIDQIQQQCWGEVCWYFPKTREQLRLLGTLTVVCAEDDTPLQQARLHLWQSISEAARLQFAWPPSGEPRSPAAAFTPPPPDPLTPLPTFCLLLLDPMQVDHLELRGEPQNRDRYHRDDEGIWRVMSVNP